MGELSYWEHPTTQLLELGPDKLPTTPDGSLDREAIAHAVNKCGDALGVGQFSSSLWVSMLKHIPPEAFSRSFVSNILNHSPFIWRDVVLANDKVSLSDIFLFDLTFVETDPSQFSPKLASDLQSKNIQTLTHVSLYTWQSGTGENNFDTQQTLYHAQMPTLLIIETGQLHSGHNDLLQDRRWLGRKISDHVKILIVGDYSELTGDVQNRIEATYMDEYSVQFEQAVSQSKASAPDDLGFKQLPRLTTEQIFGSEIVTLESVMREGKPSRAMLILQNSDELRDIPEIHKREVYRYLPTRSVAAKQPSHTERTPDIVIYQYMPSCEKQVEYALIQNQVRLADRQAITTYLADKVLRIPQKPKLGIVSTIQKKDGKWLLKYRRDWYPIADVHVQDLSISGNPITNPVKANLELLEKAYFDHSPLYMDNNIAKDIFKALSTFVTSENQCLILEGVPALGKDAYTHHFLATLKPYAYNLYTQEITASSDQPLLEQLIDIYHNHPTKDIVLQISEINLISPSQLDEIRHFLQGKNIKIIGTQNAQSQFQNRFKLDESVFSIITLKLQSRASYFDGLIKWLSRKYETPILREAFGRLNLLYSDEDNLAYHQYHQVLIPLSYQQAKSSQSPPTLRQLGCFAKKLHETAQKEGLTRAREIAPALFNTIFFQHLHFLQMLPFPISKSVSENILQPNSERTGTPDQPIEPAPNGHTGLETLTLSDMQAKQKQLHALVPSLVPGTAAPPNIWQGSKQNFLTYQEGTVFYLSQQAELSPSHNVLTTTVRPGQTIIIPQIVGSHQGTISLYTESGQLLDCSLNECERMFDRKERRFHNPRQNPVVVKVTYSGPIPFFSEVKSTTFFDSKPSQSLDGNIHKTGLSEDDVFVLRRFIYEKTGSEAYTQKALLLALGLPNKAAYSEREILTSVVDYFAGFREESIPSEEASGNWRYDMLYFQKGVCRHQAELGMLIFSALGIHVGKIVSLNHQGVPFHDYLIMGVADKRVVMDFTYTSHHMIQAERELEKAVSPDLNCQDVYTEEPAREGVFSDYIASLALVMRDSLVLSENVYTYWRALFSAPQAPDADTTKEIVQPLSEFTLSELLTGTKENWEIHKEALKWQLFEEIPPQGVEFETRFVPTSTVLASFGTPVYLDEKLLGYRIQKEVPVSQSYNGIVLDPTDIIPGQDETLLLTPDGVMKVGDWTTAASLIQGSGESHLRALELVQDLSAQLNTPFVYDEELGGLQSDYSTSRTEDFQCLSPSFRYLRGPLRDPKGCRATPSYSRV